MGTYNYLQMAGPFWILELLPVLGLFHLPVLGILFVLTSKYISTDLLMPVLGIPFCAYIDLLLSC